VFHVVKFSSMEQFVSSTVFQSNRSTGLREYADTLRVRLAASIFSVSPTTEGRKQEEK
jgi:hypothetical protein